MKIFRPGTGAKLKPYLIPKLPLLFLLFITAVMINSCKKDNKSAPPSNPQIAEARAWYESKYPLSGKPDDKQTQGAGNGHDLSHWVKPDWQNTATYVRNSQSVIEMPIDPNSKFGSTMQLNKKRYNPAYSRSYFLLINDGTKYDAYILTIIADSAYVNNDFSKLANNTYRKHDADFSGTVLYFTPKGDYVGGYGYKNGQLIAPGVSTVKTGSTQIQSVGTGNVTTNNMKEECTDWYIVYFVDGVYQSDEYLATTCVTYDDGNNGGSDGNPPAPPPPPCPPGTHPGPPVERPCTKPAIASVNDRPITINYILPPPGDGGLPAPNKTACVVDPPAKPCPIVEDPCAQAKKLVQNATFKSKMNDLKSKTGLTKEVGYYTNAQGSYTYVQGAVGAAGIDFTVSAPISSYVHTHYTGTFPTFSGSDVKAIYDLQKAGKVADISNFTAGVVTASGTTYLIKISDPAKFAAFGAANFSTAAKFDTFEHYYSNNQTGYNRW
jgi:hypothetical protein